MTPAHIAPHVALCAALGTTAALLIQYGHHTPARPTAGHTTRRTQEQQMTDSRTLTKEQLLHLVDRARRGTILAPELDDLHAGIEALAADRDQYRADCQKWAGAVVSAEKVRRAHAADAERYEAELRARITELTAGQCTHIRRMCDLHHRVPVTDCPYPRCVAARTQAEEASC